jgi:hypothetical protein
MEITNWLSMVLATIMPLLIGLVYYHPALFGKTWMDSIGQAGRQHSRSHRVIAIAVALVFCFFLSFFLLNFNNGGINQEGDFDTFKHGAWHGAFIAITTAAPIIVINGLFGHRSWKSMLINLLYWVITLALMGGLLDALNHWENIVLQEG